MDDLLNGWTIERVTLLAPDTSSAQTGRRLADPQNPAWQLLGHDGYSLWGQYAEDEENIYQVKIDLLKLQKGDQHWHCGCRTRKSPCQHVLALLYLIVEQPDTIQQGEAPTFVVDWLGKSGQRARKQEERKNQRDDVHIERDAELEQRYQDRKQKIADGLDELEQWLINLIRRGLADPQVQSYEFWDSRAARLVDAQAPGIATWLREMGGIPARGSEWIEPLLDQLGRLYLLIESFKRFDGLGSETQADIRTVLGWHMKPNEIRNEGGVHDHWLVIGLYAEDMSERLRTQRVWLRGKKSGRDALIQEFAYGDTRFATFLKPGSLLEARLVFFPSRYPLRAFIGEKFGDISADYAVTGHSIQDSIVAYSKALSQNPWLPQFPFLLDNVVTTRYGEDWVLREDDGTYLPLSDRFKHKWSLLALSGGHPIQVAGEWDGAYFYPTGAVAEERFVDFGVIGKV